MTEKRSAWGQQPQAPQNLGAGLNSESIARSQAVLKPPPAPVYPVELQQLRQWVCYRLVPHPDGKTDKIPVNPHTGDNASTTDATTWGMFNEAMAYWQTHPTDVHGVGFVFTPTDPYFGVDPDECLDEAGNPSPLAQHLIELLQTYTAYSQSGRGLHIIGKGELPPGGREKKGFGGLYDSGRFFALTGKPFPGTPLAIAERQAEIEAIHAELFPPKKKETSTPPPSVDDRALLDTMFTAANGARIRRLWEGDTSEYPSQSEADQALCNDLAFWCQGDTARMDRLFRQSGLYRTKWDREDYRTKTLEKAQAQRHSYDPKYGKPAIKQAKEDAAQRQNGAAPSTPLPRIPVLVRLSDVEEKSLEWVWYPYFAKGQLVFVDGDPGLGKSLFVDALAAFLSQDKPLFPDQQGKPSLPYPGPCATLLLTAEDSLSHTVKRRIREAGGDDTKVIALEGWYGPEGEIKQFTLQQIDILRAAIEEVHPLLVIIDPIAAYLGPIDMHRANETRPLMTALSDLAEEYGAVIACVRHPSKGSSGSSGKVIYRGQGNMDMIGAARSAFFAEQHPLEPTKVFLCHYKSNHGTLGRTQIFSKAQGRFEWCGVTRLSAEAIAGDERGHMDPKTFLKACLWLESHLQGGLPQPSKDIFTAAEEHGFSQKDLKRAKDALGVTAHKRGMNEGWDWKLPNLSLLPSHPPHVEDSSQSSISSSSSQSSHSSTKSIVYENSPEDTVSYEDAEDAEDAEEFASPVAGHPCPECHATDVVTVGGGEPGWATCRQCYHQWTRQETA